MTSERNYCETVCIPCRHVCTTHRPLSSSNLEKKGCLDVQHTSKIDQNIITHWVCRHVDQEGHDGPASLHWLIREIPSFQTLQYLEIG